MATERFPKRTYLRQLRKMVADLDWWMSAYAASAEQVGNAYLRGQFAERLTTLRATRVAIAEAFDALQELPRLS